MDLEDLREEVYNEVIQEYSDLQYHYSGDKLQDKIEEIVEERLKEITR